MVSFPPCKINLGLHVVRKRNDGFHELETCFYPIPWTDALEIIKSNTFSFTSSGIVIPGDPSENLCVKAYRLIQKDFDISPVKIHLHKIIPTGAGLGGGSSDAAFTLRMLNTIFSLGISVHKLQGYAAMLGSDCAFFIHDEPMMGSGRGEILSPTRVSLKGKYILLVKPEVHVSTAQAFAGIKPAIPEKALISVLEGSLTSWKHSLKNDFEATVFAAYPQIATIKSTMYEQGAIYASMSGTGSAVFGIFDQRPGWTPTREWVSWSGQL